MMPEYRVTGTDVVSPDGTIMPFRTEFEAPNDLEAIQLVKKKIREWEAELLSIPGHPTGRIIAPSLHRIDQREKTTYLELGLNR